jgi:malate dehydrogenase (oxaloacetate-decarboxylating)(NADP+)
LEASAPRSPSPRMAVPVLAIAENPELAYEYTTKGNMVAVISNGTATPGE